MFKSLKGSSSVHSGRIVRRKGEDLITCRYINAVAPAGTDYFSYNKELYNILRLNMVGTKLDKRTKRVKFTVWDEAAKEQLTIYASHLALGCYRGKIRLKTLVADIKACRDEQKARRSDPACFGIWFYAMLTHRHMPAAILRYPC